jgi:hypothetical protein
MGHRVHADVAVEDDAAVQFQGLAGFCGGGVDHVGIHGLLFLVELVRDEGGLARYLLAEGDGAEADGDYFAGCFEVRLEDFV